MVLRRVFAGEQVSAGIKLREEGLTDLPLFLVPEYGVKRGGHPGPVLRLQHMFRGGFRAPGQTAEPAIWLAHVLLT